MEKCSYKITKPKKKKRCFQEKESPFPVPVASISGVPAEPAKWCYYTGQLVDNHVEVIHTGDMDLLSKMGFFGQGNIWGRHGPKQNGRWKIKGKRRNKALDCRELQIISRRKYLRRLKWEELLEGSSSYSQELSYDTLPLRSSMHSRNLFEDTSVHADAKPQDTPVIDKKHNTSSSNSNETNLNIVHIEENTTCQEISPDSWGTSQTKEDPWASTTEQEAADFWGMAEKPDIEQKVEMGENQSTLDNTITSHSVGVIENTNTAKTSEHSLGSENLTETSSNKGKIVDTDKINILSVSEKDIENSGNRTHHSNQDNVQEKINELLTSDKTYNSSDAIRYSNSPMCLDTPDSNTPAVGGTPVPSEVHVDPRCLSDHEDGSLFVVNDTDESENDQFNSEPEEESAPRLLWQPAVKRNPYVVRETLHLTFEEAFFLSYGLGCLVVLDKHKAPMKLSEMWSFFSESQSNFVQNYIVYHNFRSKGWVPKPGIKFGGDFIVYKEGPPFYHSTYVVLTRMVNEGNYDSLNDGQHPTPTWASLAGQNRITEQASKDLMICYVIKPSHLSMEDLKSPKCIKHLKIQEMVVKRWLLKHERENLQYMEIP